MEELVPLPERDHGFPSTVQRVEVSCRRDGEPYSFVDRRVFAPWQRQGASAALAECGFSFAGYSGYELRPEDRQGTRLAVPFHSLSEPGSGCGPGRWLLVTVRQPLQHGGTVDATAWLDLDSAAESDAHPSAKTAKAATAKGMPFDDVVLLEAGGDETCVVVKSGATYCAGSTRGGYNLDVNMARPIAGAEHTTRLSLGESTCAVQEQGEVVCWGENRNRTLPDGTGKYEPVTIPGLPPTSHVIADLPSLSPNWAFARDDASVWRWGAWGAPAFVPPSRVEQFEVAEPVQVESSNNFNCVLAREGKITCWDMEGEVNVELRLLI